MPKGRLAGKETKAQDATLKDVYDLAESNKSEDRLTEMDIKQAKKVLNYKDAAPEIKAEGAKKGKMIKKYSYGGAAIKGTKFKGVF